MNSRFTVVQTSLNRAEFRWKWLRFLQHTFTLGVVICALVLLVYASILLGWLTSRIVAFNGLGILAALSFVAWIVLGLLVLARNPKAPWLAAALERVDPRLLDRLNTLVFLENRRETPAAESFTLSIAKQFHWLLLEKATPSPFPIRRALTRFLIFILMLGATVLVYQLTAPWERLLAAEQAKATQAQNTDTPPELAVPPANSVEQSQTWGEVRITDPGADLKVTKVDVVPLQIEAAANQSLKKVGWFSTINGAGESPHDLPPPSEPRYAVYQPTLYLDELHLADWDVLTYYAKANTEKDDSFASEVYFVEVRPFREDILKMPGGEGGKAYEALSELSGLISQQQHVIRQTHQYIQKAPEQEKLQRQDRKKLADAESDLGESAQHLYAKMAAEMENQAIGDALDNLAKAEKSLGAAATQLQKNAMPEAQKDERTSLADLIAARKSFQKAVSENPKAFEDKKEQEEPEPVADSSKQLNQMAEFRNETKAAREFLQKTIEQQQRLAQQARSTPRSDYPRLANQERQLEESLKEFQQEHPQAFKGAHAQSDQAESAMKKAEEELQQKNLEARAATQQAGTELQKLEEAMRNRSAEQQLADAYKLKQMLDQQAQTLDRAAKSENQVPKSEVQKTASQARNTLDQLKKTAEENPTRDAFGQSLRDALSGHNKADLDARLEQLQQLQEGQSGQEQAGQARDGLAKVSKAFEQSQPKSLQMAQKSDALKPGDQESFAQGMSELESLIAQLENNRPVPAPDQAKQGHEALYNLQNGLRDQYGDNQRGQQIERNLEDVLKGEKPLEVDELKKLLLELQHFSVETTDRLAKKEDKPEVTNIDAARLPPAYRGRIQKYFQKLSEK